MLRYRISSKLISEGLDANSNRSPIVNHYNRCKLRLGIKLSGVKWVKLLNGKVLMTNGLLIYLGDSYTEFLLKDNTNFTHNTIHYFVSHLRQYSLCLSVNHNLFGGDKQSYEKYVQLTRKDLHELTTIVFPDDERLDVIRKIVKHVRDVYSSNDTLNQLLLDVMDEKERKIIKMEEKLAVDNETAVDLPF